MDIFEMPFFSPLIGNLLDSLLVALITYMWAYIRSCKKKEVALNNGVQALLFAQLRLIYTEAADNGKVTFSRLHDAQQMYLAYHRLGGNGIGTAMIEELKQMEKIDGMQPKIDGHIQK